MKSGETFSPVSASDYGEYAPESGSETGTESGQKPA